MLSLANLPFQKQFAETEWWPPERLREQQFHQIRLLVEHALNTVPFHRAKLMAVGIADSAHIASEWHQIPVLTRRELQTAGRALQSSEVPEAHGAVLSNTTSGSTGIPVTVLGTELDARFFKALELRILLWHGFNFSRKFAFIRRYQSDTARYPNGTASDRWGDSATFPFRTGPAVWLNILSASIEKQAEWIAREVPDYLNTNPSNLAALVETCAKDAISVNVSKIITTAEILSPELRRKAREAWGAEIVDVYSAQEVGHIAVQCPEHEHYHVQAEHVLVEILNDENEACAPGEVGRVVVTPLRNFAMPLLRYEIGDYAEMGEPCACGRGLPVLRRVLGRQRNMIVAPDGQRYWPFFGATGFRQIAPLTQYQFVQTRHDAIEGRLVVERPLTPPEQEALRARIQATLPYPFQIEFVFVTEIARNPGGKYEDFVSLVGENLATRR